ncbi:MAG TPA: FAD-binding oxidoreductase [Alphaproteobacteria bacterium]|nr:FAD-binding oxidoreductase [Alphaproteobacteria bacterium]
MTRRCLLQGAGASLAAPAVASAATLPASRVRPGDPGWPSAAQWAALDRQVGGTLVKLQSPLAAGGGEMGTLLRNSYYLGDEPALTQSSGYLDAWTSQPSAYAVAARHAQDVAAAVNFAREHRLRLVVKGGGHSYQGTSNAADSLLIWTRRMSDIVLHEGFVAQGCEAVQPPQPAVSLGAGVLWGAAYDAVTTRAGRYVQGGGCLTVGTAGLVQSGGFGSFSKRFGLAAAGLLEAEVVTADGQVRIANACREPELFWGLKGGGGGSLGVVTRLTLRTRELPAQFGAVFGRIKASSDAAFRRLIARTLGFYRDQLFNPHWGEQIAVRPDNSIQFAMVFQGFDQNRAQEIWRPFLDGLAEATVVEPMQIVSLPARHLWDAAFLRQNAPHLIAADDRPGAPAGNIVWAGNVREAGQFLHGYKSAWLPQSLLGEERLASLADALFAASRHWSVTLHVNKGLAGAPEAELAAARDTAINPQALDAFALAISAGEGPPAFPGMPQPDPGLARQRAAAIGRAMEALLQVAPDAGAYLSESDFFQRDWQRAFWGTNHPRLAAVKRRYDPDGVFFVHHGIGSEAWSADGFTRVR